MRLYCTKRKWHSSTCPISCCTPAINQCMCHRAHLARLCQLTARNQFVCDWDPDLKMIVFVFHYLMGKPCNGYHDCCRYLGVYLESASHFKCSICEAKKSFYRSFNSIFGKIGRIASEDVVLELVNKQSLPVLLYALEVCSISKSDFKALDYVVDSVFKKVFNTFNKETVFECREMFNFAPVSEIISRRAHSFTLKYSANETCNKLFEAVKLVS